jgi:hypothetical protein
MTASQIWVVDGLRIRVEPGHKGNGDRVFFVGDCKVTFGAVGWLVAELYANEERVNPRPLRRGGGFVLTFIARSCQRSVDQACDYHRLKRPRVVRVK